MNPNEMIESSTLKNWGKLPHIEEEKTNIAINCGWGRLVFANTFQNLEDVAKSLLEEKYNQRDIAFYVRDPHIVISYAPNDLFIDPSLSYRLDLDQFKKPDINTHINVRKMQDTDLDAINTIYKKAKMVPLQADSNTLLNQNGLSFWVAELNNEVCGVCCVLDHVELFKDPYCGVSLWSLAVDSESSVNKVGLTLMTHIISYYQNQGHQYLDVSVMGSNDYAKALYIKLGFERTGVFCIKRKNAVNEKLFTAEDEYDQLNSYSRIIINEAQRRGIGVDVIDAEQELVKYTFGGREVVCWESLSELTSSISLLKCQNKALTHSILKKANIAVPQHQMISEFSQAQHFFNTNQSVVIKPVDGEQGFGVSVDIQDKLSLKKAFESAKEINNNVLIEAFHKGTDLRIVVINYQVVAAATRIPPHVTGDGVSTIETLIKKQSRRRETMTDGESSIPIDSETRSTLKEQGYQLHDILPGGTCICVRKAANLHQGGTINDVTEILHPKLKAVAEKAAKVLRIPVVGLDFIVDDPKKENYVVIEANERPGLANHEPQPTAEKFLDLLFPNCPQRIN